MLTPCLGLELAEEVCSKADTTRISRAHAGISAEKSPWMTSTLPDLYAVEYTPPTDTPHSTCSVPMKKLIGCPERQNIAVHVDKNMYPGGVEAMDMYVFGTLVNEAKKVSDELFREHCIYFSSDLSVCCFLVQIQLNGGPQKDTNTSDACLESYRLHLCQLSMPICNKYGNPMRIPNKDCVEQYTKCPYLGGNSPSFYKLIPPPPTTAAAAAAAAAVSTTEYFSNPANIVKYAKAVCSDEFDFFTRTR